MYLCSLGTSLLIWSKRFTMHYTKVDFLPFRQTTIHECSVHHNMFARKLKALEYHHPDTFNINNEGEVRNLIAWVEDSCICHYKPEDRAALKDIKNEGWISAVKTYLGELKCPVDNLSKKPAVINWLLSHAVQLKYAKDTDKYNAAHEEKNESNGNKKTLINESVRIDDSEMKVGIESLRKLLKIPHHDDQVLVLRAIAKVVEDNLSEEAIKINTAKQSRSSKRDEFLSLHDTSLGFDTKDPALDEVAKILRLLQIHNLRDLQTKINAAIVNTQKITANPKTDQSLGRVGR